MGFDGFRELLVKKSDGDEYLSTFIRLIREDALTDMIIESLEKMARASHKGDAANLAIRDFGLEMDPELEPVMIHDALSHHASHYKAALKHLKENPNDAEVKDAFNHHAEKIFKLVNMAEKTQKHTDGKLSVSAPSPHAWERNIKPDQFTEESKPVLAGKKKVGQFVTDTKGWNFTGHKGNKYEFLTQAPHEAYKAEAEKQGWNGPYPLEKIKINGKHLVVDDNGIDRQQLLNHDENNKPAYNQHMFDSHPIMDHYHMSPSKRSVDHDRDYKAGHDKFHSSISDDWWNKHAGFSDSHGQQASTPVHEHGVTLMGKGQGGSGDK